MKKDRCEDSGQASENRLLSDSRSVGIIAKELNMCNEICNECDMYSAKGCILKGEKNEHTRSSIHSNNLLPNRNGSKSVKQDKK